MCSPENGLRMLRGGVLGPGGVAAEDKDGMGPCQHQQRDIVPLKGTCKPEGKNAAFAAHEDS